LIRQEAFAAAVHEAGAHAVVAGPPEGVAAHGPYDLILESVGGRTFEAVIAALAPQGTLVTLGASESETATFNLRRFFWTGGTKIVGFRIFHEFGHTPAGPGLRRLAELIVEDRLHPRIDVEAPWTEIADVAERLMDRRFPGKAVLHL
jgi:NADPH:quinone reductase-like Zn-dependent oxidoreductase